MDHSASEETPESTGMNQQCSFSAAASALSAVLTFVRQQPSALALAADYVCLLWHVAVPTSHTEHHLSSMRKCVVT
jgi:hypothetical protein